MTTSCSAFDLHCHSTASDGTLAPADVVLRAAAAGIRTLALTDHDTLAGFEEAEATAQIAGIDLLSAVEFSTALDGRPLHVVGLGIDRRHPALTAGLAELDQIRRTRAERIASKLRAAGIEDALAQCEALAGHCRLTRTHFARLLVTTGRSKDMKQAFSRWLGAGKRAYESVKWPELDSTIGVIHDAGGLAVLAHPLRYGFTHSRRRDTLAAFRAAGGDAAEVSTAGLAPRELTRIANECASAGLMASAGSDFHDPAQQWIRFGALPALPDCVTPVWQHAALAACFPHHVAHG